MKYGVLISPINEWLLLDISKVKMRTATGTVLYTPFENCYAWRIGEKNNSWVKKAIVFVSKKEADFILKTHYFSRPKLTVDFDKTLFPSPNYPKIGKQKLVHKIVSSYVRYKHRQGWIIILNTMREKGKGLEEAKKACFDNNIPIDLYNENYGPDIVRWGESRKIGATLSIDDTQIGFIGWLLRKFG
jgi:hypothetical protein